MRVPEYQRRVPIETARTQAPRKPTISMPRTIPGAFGVNVGQAMQNLGKVGEQIAIHLQKMAIDKQDKEELRRENEFMQDWQNNLTNQEEETVTINNQQVTRKKGLLLRELDNADGVTLEANETFQKMRGEKLKGLTQYQIDKLTPFMDRHFLTVQGRVTTHEANQLDESNKLTTASNLALKAQEASLIRTDEQLSFAIDDAIKSASSYYRKYDEATRKVLNEKIASSIIEASAVSTLQGTGNLTFAEALLDSAKKKIAQSTYNDIRSKLAQGDKSMKAEAERIEVINKVNGRFDYVSKIADGTLDWANSAEIIRQVAITDPKLAEAMTKNIQKGGFEVEEKDEVFMELAQSIFTSADSKTISDFLVKALSETESISRDRLAVLVYAARKRAEELNKGESRGFLESIVNAITIQNPIMASAANILINTLKRLQKGTPGAEKAMEITNEEIDKQGKIDREDTLSENDNILSEGVGRIYATKGKQRIYSDDGGTTWYDEKTNKVIK